MACGALYLVILLCVRQTLAQFYLLPVNINESALLPRVVGGTTVELGDLPYQVGFKMRHTYYHFKTFCGGTIIRENKVLSAAHCFGKAGSSCFESTTIRGQRLNSMYAVAGNLQTVAKWSEDGAGGGQWRRLHIVIYPSVYKFPFHSDISIVMTKIPFIFNSHVNKIGYSRTYRDYKGTCLASGYGMISHSHRIQSNRLLKAELALITTYWCNMRFRRNMKHLICTSTIPTDVGKGDSGGPLVCRNTGEPNEGPYGILVGVTSGSSPSIATFFTRVSTFASYIDSNRSQVNSDFACFKSSVFVWYIVYLVFRNCVYYWAFF